MIVCLDTNIVVYLIETDPTWTPRAAARLSALHAAGDEVAVCDAAVLECLIHPLAAGDAIVEADYRAFFTIPWCTFCRCPVPPGSRLPNWGRRSTSSPWIVCTWQQRSSMAAVCS